MAKSESDIFTPRTGQVIQAENGTQYFVCGNNRIKISEHFAAGGKPLGDLSDCRCGAAYRRKSRFNLIAHH